MLSNYKLWNCFSFKFQSNFCYNFSTGCFAMDMSHSDCQVMMLVDCRSSNWTFDHRPQNCPTFKLSSHQLIYHSNFIKLHFHSIMLLAFLWLFSCSIQCICDKWLGFNNIKIDFKFMAWMQLWLFVVLCCSFVSCQILLEMQ